MARSSVVTRSGGVPWVWKLAIVLRPQAWPFLRSSSVQVMGFQSGASRSRGSGVCDLDPIAARKGRTSAGPRACAVRSREHTILKEHIGGAWNVFAAVERVGEVMGAAVHAVRFAGIRKIEAL